VGRLREAGGLVVVENETGLVSFVTTIIADAGERSRMTDRAKAMARGESEVIVRTVVAFTQLALGVRA
jgi:hypothetical protein